MNFENIKIFIEKELNEYFETIDVKCKSLTKQGKQCSKKVNVFGNHLCKKHENSNQIIRKMNCQYIIYHNHLPDEKNIENCPICNS